MLGRRRAALTGLLRSKTRAARQRFVDWLLDDLHLRGVQFGQESISLSPVGAGDVIRWSGTQLSTALGDVGMDVSTGRLSMYVGGATRAVAHTGELGGGGVTVEEEGTGLGSFTTLNFVGSSVTATDAGGGQADITVTGGSGGENVIVFDSAGSGTNVYSTLAAAVTAVMALDGDRILRVVETGSHVFPTGTFDGTGLHILADKTANFGPGRAITFGEGTVFSRVPKAIRGFDTITFSNTATPIYNGDGEGFDLELETGVEGGQCQSTSTAHAFIINDTLGDFACRLAIYGYTNLRKVGTGSVLRLENIASLKLEMHDQATVSTTASGYPFSEDGALNNFCEVHVIGTGAEFACPTTNAGNQTITDVPLGNSGRDGVVNVHPNFLGRLATNLGQTNNVPAGVNYGGTISGALTNNGVTFGGVWQSIHPVITFMAMHGRGSIMPSGITGNALVANGLMAGGLTASAITTALNVGTNIRRIEAGVTTGAVLGDEAGWQTTDTVCARGVIARVTIGFRLNQTTAMRMFIGVSDRATRSDNTAADNPAAASMAGIQFSTNRGDTRLQFMVQSAGTQTLQAIEPAGAPSTTINYVLEIVFTGQTTAANIGTYMRLFRHANGTTTDLGSHTFTVTQSPPAGTALRVVSSIQTRAAATKTLQTHAVNLSTGN